MITIQELEQFIDRQDWTFAKTYAHFSPHSYVTKHKLTYNDKRLFEEFVIFLYTSNDINFRKEVKFDRPWQVYANRGMKYWCHAIPFDFKNKEKNPDKCMVYDCVSPKKYVLKSLTEYLSDVIVINRHYDRRNNHNSEQAGLFA